MTAALIIIITICLAALAMWRSWQDAAWVCWEDVDTTDQDVMPYRDRIEHEFGEDCVCGPTTIPLECEDGELRWVYKHHRLDERSKRGPMA